MKEMVQIPLEKYNNLKQYEAVCYRLKETLLDSLNVVYSTPKKRVEVNVDKLVESIIKEAQTRDAEVRLFNVHLANDDRFKNSLSDHHIELLKLGYPIERVLTFTEEYAEAELEALQ